MDHVVSLELLFLVIVPLTNLNAQDAKEAKVQNVANYLNPGETCI